MGVGMVLKPQITTGRMRGAHTPVFRYLIMEAIFGFFAQHANTLHLNGVKFGVDDSNDRHFNCKFYPIHTGVEYGILKTKF